MDVTLRVVDGPKAGLEIPVKGQRFVIGRGADCQLRPNSDLISRRHCALVVDGRILTLQDFGSKNGTFVNEQRVEGEQMVSKGDHIRVGPLLFEVHTSETLGGSKRPKVKDVREAAERTVRAAPGKPFSFASWLDEDHEPDDAATKAAVPRDTGKLDLAADDTVADVSAEAIVSTDDSAAEKTAPDGAKAKSGRPEKKEPGKLPPPPMADDTSSAAADMLRRMRKGR